MEANWLQFAIGMSGVVLGIGELWWEWRRR